MSATGRGRERNKNDRYFTPSWCVDRLMEKIDLPLGIWLEPAFGDGAICRAVNACTKGINWWGMDIVEPERTEYAITFQHDFLSYDGKFGPDEHYDVIMSNPPYRLAQRFVEKSISLKPLAVVMLLRLNFLGSQERASWFQKDTPDVYVLPNRPDFTGGGGDSTEYAWFVWYPRYARNLPYGRLHVLNTSTYFKLEDKAKEKVEWSKE